MLSNRIIGLCIVFSMLLSCLNNENQDVSKKRTEVVEDGEGNLKSKISYIDDTLEHEVSEYYYYPTNVLKDEIEFKYGIKEGWHKHYSKDGTLESKIHFENGLQEGDTYWYYPNGVLKEHSFWVKGQGFGLSKWYYQNGQLELINVKDFWKKVFYVIQYDKQGKKIKEDGLVFSPNFWYVPHRDSMPINEEILIQIAVADLPETKTRIYMGKMGKILKQLPVEEFIATYQDTFGIAGIYNLVTIGEIYNIDGSLLKRDSITTKIRVIE